MTTNYKLLEPKISANTSVLLDIIRVIAVQLVVIGHISWFIIDLGYLYLAKIGVLLFFILSGFLISNSIFSGLQKESYNFKIYFIDRFARIYTGLVPCMLIIFILSTVQIIYNPSYYVQFFGTPLQLSTIVGNLFMLQNGIVPQFGNAFPLWTLAIEWWLYIFFGWFIIQSNNKDGVNPNHKLLFICGTVLFSFILLPELRTHNLVIIWLLTASVIIISRKEYKYAWFVAGVGVFSLGKAIYYILYPGNNEHDIYSDFLIPIPVVISFTTLIFLSDTKIIFLNKKVSNIIKFMADYSFTLYLLHFSILSIFFMWFSGIYGTAISIIIALIMTNIFSACVAVFTEMHYKKVGKYIKTKLNYV